MHLTQGTFSYLPPLTDDGIRAQIQYAVDHGWVVAIEFTDDPHPRNAYWEMWSLPMFDVVDAAGPLQEVKRCRDAFPNHYIRLTAYDPSYGRQTTALAFIVNRPLEEPGFRLDRQEGADRSMRYTIHSYAVDTPKGARYGSTG